MLKSLVDFLNKITDVPNAAGDWKRRGKALNVILIAFIFLSMLGLVANLVYYMDGMAGLDETILAGVVLVILILSNCLQLYICRHHSVYTASAFFLLILIILLFVADTPEATVWGQNMIPLTLPIVMAGLIMQPIMSFVAAGIISLGAIVLALATDQPINAFGTLTYLSLALISWLTTRHLERAIKDLFETNQVLDLRVMERTEELSITNGLLEKERETLEIRVEERTSEILEMNRKLVRMSRVKDEFLASMSHELRTPLNAILGYSEGILEEAEEEEELDKEFVIEDIDRIRQAGSHLLHLINDILDISKLEANQMTLNFRRMNVDGVINKLLITIEPAMAKNSNEFVVQNNFPNESIVSDEYKIMQIMLNLLSNATKFTEAGKVSLLVTSYRENLIAFQVTDTGIGIPEEAFQRIFEPFRQVENAKSRSYDGTGLGLAISQKLANALGGEITVSSEVGVGSTFTLVLPTKPIHKLMDQESQESLKFNATLMTVT